MDLLSRPENGRFRDGVHGACGTLFCKGNVVSKPVSKSKCRKYPDSLSSETMATGLQTGLRPLEYSFLLWCRLAL